MVYASIILDCRVCEDCFIVIFPTPNKPFYFKPLRGKGYLTFALCLHVFCKQLVEHIPMCYSKFLLHSILN
jgi:hypothetical protein